MNTKIGNRVRAALTAACVAGLTFAVSACVSPEQSSAPQYSDAVSAEVRDAAAQEGPVVLAKYNWAAQVISTELATQVLKAMGADVSTQTMDATTGWAAISRNDDLAALEIWPPTHTKPIEQYVETEKSVKIHDDLGYSGTEGWHVPTYVIKGDPERGIEPLCPGLPDWHALNDCAEIFATAETGGKGRYLSGDPAWASMYGDQDRINNLGLNYEMQFAGSEAALVAEIKRAYDRGEPLLFLMWTPHFVTSNYDLTMVEFPEYTDECWGDTYACAWPSDDNYWISSVDFEEKHPLAFQMLQNYDLPQEAMDQIIVSVDGEGMTVEEAVATWMSENQEMWQSWIPTQVESS